ncbi:AMP-binding protein [Bradyrhizobium betae]
MAGGLRLLGLERGDRIGIWSPNRVEWLVTQFATARLGLVLVKISPAYRLSELEYALPNKVGCKAIVAAGVGRRRRRYLEMLQDPGAGAAKLRAGRVAEAARLPTLRWVIRMGGERTPGMLNYDRRWHTARTPSPGSWTRSPRNWIATTRSISSSPAEPPARRRAPR